MARRREIFASYVAAGLPLWPRNLGAGCEPCHYRAVLRAANPQQAIRSFDSAGIRAIIPIEEWELLADAADFPRAAALARSTVSIPIYPALSAQDVAGIVAAALSINFHGEQKSL
jgi:dTDP-4-amino-4,6-dideoxygalactose transaminase